jgi:TonB family protein
MKAHKYFSISLLILAFCCLSAPGFGHGRSHQQADLPTVVMAAAPVYPVIAASANANGEVVVEVQIDGAGNVTSVKVKSGHPLLQRAALAAAKRWKFSPNRDQRASRMADLTFVFRLTPEGEVIPEDITTKFMPPYRIEITRRPPVIDY